MAVAEPGGLEPLEELVATLEVHAVAPPDRGVAERGRQERLAYTDGTEDQHRIIWGCLIASAMIASFAGVMYTAQVGAYTSDIAGLPVPRPGRPLLRGVELSQRPNLWGTLIAYFALAFGTPGPDPAVRRPTPSGSARCSREARSSSQSPWPAPEVRSATKGRQGGPEVPAQPENHHHRVTVRCVTPPPHESAYHWFQCTIPSASLRGPGRKSVPFV